MANDRFDLFHKAPPSRSNAILEAHPGRGDFTTTVGRWRCQSVRALRYAFSHSVSATAA
jgi:hypothetical protein